MRENSTTAYLSRLPVGGRYYVETKLEHYDDTMRKLNPASSKRGPEIKHMKFSCTLLTAVGTKAGDVRFLVCVERLE